MRLSGYRRTMFRPSRNFILILLLASACSVSAASGKIIKVLPQFIDLKGRTALSPSLYDRDAYQIQLRQHPEQRSGIRFHVQWRGRSEIKNLPATIRVELRGTSKGDLPTEVSLESAVRITQSSHWEELTLDGVAFRQFGEVTAWRVTLWSGGELLGEQKSFLW